MAANSTSAQTLGGPVSVATRPPTPALLVTTRTGDSVVASTRTDRLGIFYLTPPKAGVYQVYFGDADQGQFVVDSLVIGADEFVRRDFAGPPNRTPAGEATSSVRYVPSPTRTR